MEDADSKPVPESRVSNASPKASQAQAETSAEARLEPTQAHDSQIRTDTSSTAETRATNMHQMKKESHDQNGGSATHDRRGEGETNNGEGMLIKKPSEDPANPPSHNEEFVEVHLKDGQPRVQEGFQS